ILFADQSGDQTSKILAGLNKEYQAKQTKK
ncbi:MAG: OmpH family outer membrane protein, partial [Pedobacter sp.]